MDETTAKSKVIGINLCVDHTTLAIVDVRGNILARDSICTSDYAEVTDFVSVLSEKIILLAEANGGYEAIRSVGISSPSANFVTGCIENAPNLKWKGSVPLAAMLRDRLGMAVALANNAYVTALGEQAFGSAHGMKNFIVVSLGYVGIGSCFFSNGMAHIGARGFSGEFGHCCVVPNGRQCTCGHKGCLEEYISARGMKQTADELLASTDEPSLMRGADVSPMSLVSYCEQGDKLAIKVCTQTGRVLGIALADYASLLDPEAIIMTGDLTKMGKWLVEPMIESFDAHVFHNISGNVRIFSSVLDNDDRNVLGASALAWEVKEYSLFK